MLMDLGIPFGMPSHLSPRFSQTHSQFSFLFAVLKKPLSNNSLSQVQSFDKIYRMAWKYKRAYLEVEGREEK